MDEIPRATELFVFDWDGTIFDSAWAIASSIRAAAADLRLPVPSEGLARSAIGLGLVDCLRRAVPSIDEEDIEPFCLAYRDHYYEYEPKTGLFPGIDRLLRGMKARGMRLACATGKSRRGLARVKKRFGYEDLFEAERTSDLTEPKPSPVMLREISAECGVPMSRIAMVGDSVHDMAMARAAGAWAIGVTYGAMPAESLRAAGAQTLCGTVEELAAALGVPDLA